MRVLVLAVAFLAVGCSSSEGSDGPAGPAVTLVTTPRPSEAQAAELAAAIRAVYPEAPMVGANDKAVDWAVSTCSDILDGAQGLEGRVVARFSGPDRPDPTAEQAAAIVEVVRSNGFCTGA